MESISVKGSLTLVHVADHLKLTFRHDAALDLIPSIRPQRTPSRCGSQNQPGLPIRVGSLVLHVDFKLTPLVSEQGTKSEQNPKPLSIFSVHVHPDGSRIATGGLDAKVRIWSTKPILNESAELSGRPPKLLSTLSMHTGPVLAVRWAFSGRWLASGSDDTIVMIWDLDP